MTRELLYTKIEEVENDVMDMGTLCMDALKDAVESFLSCDKELAKKVRENDDIIDRKEMEIEEKCVSIIALQQPVASDLRTILTVIKIISKLEKIGDNASKIAKITLKSKLDGPIKNEVLNVMLEYLEKMLKDALISFKTKNESLARDVYNRDKKIDTLYNQLYREMISYIVENPKNTTKATEIIFVGKYLERSSNLVASIGDRVVYMITGERIKEEEFDFKHFE
ncbi:phosphate signaling complex protein PhoU [Methanothermococcus okinawensis]|uniref:Phosphate-specific transport system accessory protein PhoU n=1 Tax=Methanothermococcus okinawensis (strain DSM 14208 / JCM 11175 / IH1) TaxID=647113 RepID=F8ANL6_METOI|nr:phosphate signaling complex protein PhoU [Methanothermococcus okinawensis]AEH07072.1 phosphate uptake regulator, PhoU [Methanothermococcus okinawensis IH1]